MKTKIKKAKDKVLNACKRLKDGSYSLNGWRIRPTPTDKFPDLVGIHNKNLEIQKKFITFDKATAWINAQRAERIVASGSKLVQKELKTIGKGELINDTPFSE